MGKDHKWVKFADVRGLQRFTSGRISGFLGRSVCFPSNKHLHVGSKCEIHEPSVVLGVAHICQGLRDGELMQTNERRSGGRSAGGPLTSHKPPICA